MRFSALLSSVGALLLAASMQAQDNGLKARQVYYKPQTGSKAQESAETGQKQTETTTKNTSNEKRTTSGKKTTKPPDTTGSQHDLKVEPPRLGLKYVIEQVQPSGGTVQVDPEKVFRTGEGIRLRIEVNRDAYVYLVTKGSSGEWSVLFPEPGEGNHLKAFTPVLVPAAPADPITFEEPAGSETLYIRVSRTPITDLQNLLPANRAEGQKLMAAVPKQQVDDMFRREKLEARDLTRGKVRPVANTNPSNPENNNEWAFYVVKASTSPDSEIIQKFELRHR